MVDKQKVIFVIVLIIIAATVMWYYLSLQERTEEVYTPISTIQPTVTLETKLYRNEEWGFEFQYPESWSFHPNTFYNPFSKFNLVGASPGENNYPDPLAPSVLVNVVTPDFADHAFTDLKNTASEVTGVMGLKYKYEYEGLIKIAVVLPFGPYVMILSSYETHENVFNQVISTLKFLK